MRQGSLFADDPQAFVSEADARRILGPVEPLIWQAVVQPWIQFGTYRESDPNFLCLEATDAAWWMHGQVKHSAKKLCSEYPELNLTHQRRRQQDFFLLDGQATLIFKKITQRWRQKLHRTRYERSNFKTTQNSRLWQQRREAGFPDLPRFLVGYEFVQELTGIRLFIGYPRNEDRGFSWIYQMDDYSKAVLRPIVTVPFDGDGKGFKVKPRKEAEERATK